MLPFSSAEFLRARGKTYSRYMPAEKVGEMEALADEYLEYSGYPAVVLSEGARLKLKVLQELYESVMQCDIVERLGVRRASSVRAFMGAALGSACRRVSVRSISRWLESEGITVGRQTAINYLDGAESVCLPYLPCLPLFKEAEGEEGEPQTVRPGLGVPFAGRGSCTSTQARSIEPSSPSRRVRNGLCRNFR